ncbi:unnamed protein product [Thlaspi arvense]|uniref:TF-B3 domain-containing protein n=1 Tax=Thlaspi arvense TaxID=13288 RepID=A0AAU9RIB1_THLAR|nr:unnamed protein product [Thlaspi arvense]
MVETGEKVSSPPSNVRKDLEFFKVFLPEFSSHELEIPPAFIDILKKPLPNHLLLIDEIGRLWGVETKAEERVRLAAVSRETVRVVVFKRGWEKFANDQSLEFGDFLVFRYDGDSRFSVTIFAKDGCKKDLGLVTTTGLPRVSVAKEPVVADPAKISTKPERRQGCCGERVNQTWKRDSVKEKPIRTESEDVSTIKTEPDDESTIKTESEQWINSRRKVYRARDPCGVSWFTHKKLRGFEESVIKPKNPHFVRNITDISLRQMEIPTAFLKDNGIDMEEDIELCDENGKKWPLKIVNRNRRLTFSQDSWLCFCESHELKKTCKCIFEFIVRSNGKCNDIQVRIVRGSLLTTVTKRSYQVLAV